MHIVIVTVAEDKGAGCFMGRSLRKSNKKKKRELLHGKKSEVTLLNGTELSQLCDGDTLPKPVMVSYIDNSFPDLYFSSTFLPLCSSSSSSYSSSLLLCSYSSSLLLCSLLLLISPSAPSLSITFFLKLLYHEDSCDQLKNFMQYLQLIPLDSLSYVYSVLVSGYVEVPLQVWPTSWRNLPSPACLQSKEQDENPAGGRLWCAGGSWCQGHLLSLQGSTLLQHTAHTVIKMSQEI